MAAGPGSLQRPRDAGFHRQRHSECQVASQHLTKSRYIAGLQCPRRLWLLVHEPLPYEEPARCSLNERRFPPIFFVRYSNRVVANLSFRTSRASPRE